MTERIVVAGGGPVGLAFAGAASGFDVTVIEASPSRVPPVEGFDLRVFAVSPGTRDFLRELGAWAELDEERIAPVKRMEIFGDDGARLAFAAPSGGQLASIVEAGRLTAALEKSVARRGNVRVLRSTPASSFGAGAGGAWAELANGERVEGDLLVGADGPDSPVRTALGMAVDERPYGETAVVAHFETEHDAQGLARQWFLPEGVLAWLPLPGSRISIVWSAPAAVADALSALEPQALAARVRDAGGACLGDLRLASGVARFPLRWIRVPQPVARGVALIGDAAHAVHPLAGQGVNLGFQDAKALARVLAERSRLERAGDLAVLRRYARARSEDVGAMQLVTHGLDRLFAAERPGVAALRGAGLRMVERASWAKRLLATRAMR
ncbi:2-octaprenylphenol hydroxylase [Usitatibacter rugosus]|uniref:2-octaprenylphenol hydroxylase n=1 Tax=Usitatibacter rugosus TaxID=2732067 RepID=A0A6M4GRG1_9PROT|nr:FAD-dependent monooxygenase [Usitatibacter rugosus]QJR09368.1 2-octaprenylphenol hydroxylase [Usitatibacter rugosus]